MLIVQKLLNTKKHNPGLPHILYHEIAETIDKGDQIGLVILEYAKDFDPVPHRSLLSKLDHYGIRGSTQVDYIIPETMNTAGYRGWSDI